MAFANEKKKIRAIGLLSGGLDSTLAAKLMLEQGIDVLAINFTSPFCTCTPKNAGCAAVNTAVKELGGIPLKRVILKDDYLIMVKNPKHGHWFGNEPLYRLQNYEDSQRRPIHGTDRGVFSIYR